MANDFPYQVDEFYLDLKEGSSNISMLTAEEIEKRPFPGLRPYKTAEFQLFKGRTGQAEELIKRLQNHNFLAVIGSSGTGKSSLVRAGLIPQLLGGYLYKTGNKWDIAICRPGKDPVESLSIALSCMVSRCNDPDAVLDKHREIGPKLENSLYGILEVKDTLAPDDSGEPHNLLIIVDQFEELFRFDRKDLGKSDLEKHFVNLLLKATSAPNSAVYVIITMRSEFLGDCVKYRSLPEAINDGQYLVPQLGRGQLKEVIEGPIQLARKKIEPGLVELLINEIEEGKLNENLDQLPIMQHALMRTYNKAMSSGPGTEIGYQHYKAVGGMEKALAIHAGLKYKELGDGGSEMSAKQKVAKLIFQSITDMSADQKGGRRPTDLQNIYDIVASINPDKSIVNEVIDHFRDIDTCFIMPPISTALNPCLMIDISHESLMRNWELLNNWIAEEVNDGKLYKMLNERRELFEQNIDGYIRGGLLTELMERKDRYHYNAAWAKRYNERSATAISPEANNEIFSKNIDFLLKSFNESEVAKLRENEELKERIKRTSRDKSRRVVFLILSIGIVVSVGLAVFGIYQAQRAKHWARKLMVATIELEKVKAKEEAEAKAQDSILNHQNQLYIKEAAAARHLAKKDQLLLDSAFHTAPTLKKE